jgi:hypothetical protein
MRRLLCVSAYMLCAVVLATAQPKVQIDAREVARVTRTLASDDMAGRQPFTPGIDKAADFIAAEFKKAGLKPVNDSSYFQEFNLQREKFVGASGVMDGQAVDQTAIAVFSSDSLLNVTDKDSYETATITSTDTLYPSVRKYLRSGKNYVVIVDTAHSNRFKNLRQPVREGMGYPGNVIFVLATKMPATFEISYRQQVEISLLKNVVGILPGKSKEAEQVIFSGHYDHLGIGKADARQDSIFNGANDDASGTAAVILLARHFAKLRNNERTIVFAAFTAEESGGLGSQYFSSKFKPDSVVAMFNIEMIGTDSKWGNNSAYITGYDKTDMGKILEKNLKGTAFHFYPDPYPDQQLFYRSDNATLAKLGVPAHTISTSKMDSEKYYHTQDDEFETLDMKNMAEIIKAIAISSTSIVAGKDTPGRVREY